MLLVKEVLPLQKKSGARGRRQSAGRTVANFATGSKQSTVATGGKQSTGRTGTQHNWRSSRTKKDVDYAEMPELEEY